MEGKDEFVKFQCCLGCLCRSDECLVQPHQVLNEAFKSMFQSDSISLCVICQRIAQRVELFIQNVQSNQILLENFHNQIMDLSFQKVRSETQPLINLSYCLLGTVELSGTVTDNEDETFSVIKYSKSDKVEIKLEMKEEENLQLDHLEGEFVDDDEFQPPFQEVKEEDDFPLKTILKTEIVSDGESNGVRKHSKRKVKEKSEKVQNNGQKLKKRDYGKAVTIYITKKECMAERAEMLKDPKYLNCVFRCEDCIKGFTFKASYDKHMEKHNETNGDYECDICKQRLPSEDKLHSHRRYHQVRYKCTECELVRICQRTVKDHYNAAHGQDLSQYICPQCSKVFNRQGSLRKHIWYSHRLNQRVSCAYCNKSYANKEVLKAHLMIQHPKEVSAVEASKRYVCQECGKPFKAPSHLKKHAMKHSLSRDYYCVECDKSFKSDAILQHHLKTASPHINYAELPLSCLHCDKRFSIRRDLNRHMNRIHLNIKPFQCDRCDKAYVNGWSLTEHKRLVHEGYKRPLKFPCKLCDKVFDRNSILKSHIRTHTGERPYQCSKCPATFSQASVRATHMKLIHLKLTRDGRPKVNLK